jgi:hypothetical protein
MSIATKRGDGGQTGLIGTFVFLKLTFECKHTVPLTN